MPSKTLSFYSMTTKRRRTAVPDDPSEVALYSVAEAAFIIGVSSRTLHQWIYGRDYKAQGEIRTSPPLIKPADTREGLLSFSNLAEAHVLDAIRKHNFPMTAIREAIDAIKQQYPSEREHPLITAEFYRHGKRLFIKKLNETISVSRPTQGQRVLGGDMLDVYLERIRRDDRDLPVRLFPMRANPDSRIMVDLFIASGQPVISNTGILADFIHERHVTGESIEEIAQDYGIDSRAVADAIRYVAAA
jgi:uncharacterized protein (DUF433 family)